MSLKIRVKRFFYYWFPILCFMALIFFLSSLHGSSISHFGFLDVLVKKGAHITGYAVLYFLLFRAFQSLLEQEPFLFLQSLL